MFLGHNFVFERFMQYFSTVNCVMLYGVADTHPALLELTDVVHLHRLLKLLYFIEFTHSQLENIQICCDFENFVEK